MRGEQRQTLSVRQKEHETEKQKVESDTKRKCEIQLGGGFPDPKCGQKIKREQETVSHEKVRHRGRRRQR